MRKQYFIKFEKTLFALGKDNFPYSYQVLSFRKRQAERIPLSQLRTMRSKARDLETLSKDLQGTQCLEIVEESKQKIYSHRIDLERPVLTVIAPIISGMVCNYMPDAWNLLYNGAGYSATSGKKLKPIVCREKRSKGYKAVIDSLNDYFNR